MTETADIVIIGAGIMGLAIAREWKHRHPGEKIVILEKESRLGMHASGRNSGVLHSGIYYKPDSLKARLCSEGARAMADYCDEHGLPINCLGKVIVPTQQQDDALIDLLFERAKANNVEAEIIDNQTLKEIEPEAHSPTHRALAVPKTSVVDPKAILQHIADALTSNSVTLVYNAKVRKLDAGTRTIYVDGATFQYGRLFNTAGLHADHIASALNAGCDYAILPFKGMYYELAPDADLVINSLIYPVPDLGVPFLGIHFTKSVHGAIHIGPSAVPALGRENYRGLEDVGLASANILARILQLYIANQKGFRKYAHTEAIRFFKRNLAASAAKMVPRITPKMLVASQKIGIRAQLVNLAKKELVMDFLIEKQPHATHILNAVSPAFTSAFSFSQFVLDD